MQSLNFILPWPPSVNTYWRHIIMRNRVRVMLSAKGREYRENAAGALLEQGLVARRIAERLAVHIKAHPPDRRTRDLDNCTKAPLDALTHAAVIEDDSIIDDLRITRGCVVRGGLLKIAITKPDLEIYQ